jgi:hypothetical protein
MGAVVIGNLMAAFVLGEIKESLFYIIATGLCLFTTIYNFLFILKPHPQPKQDEEKDQLLT